MRNFINALVLFVSVTLCFGQAKDPDKTFDAALAAKLGADEYGMKKYVFAFLKAGPTKIDDLAKRKELQTAHLKNIHRLAADGKLVVAGPFLDNQPIRGIYIFNVTTIEEAKQLVETDPSIQAGTLEMELHPWYGSAALMEVTRIHNMVERADITK
jgi:uncharacterized protein